MQSYRAIKSLGQHFLINESICNKIIALLEVQPEDNIIEIGPGPGALSQPLLKSSFRNLLFLEKDWRFARLLSSSPRANVILCDAMTFNWQKLKHKWKITGNLPYNIASPLIWDILSKTSDLKRAVFMTQLEVAQRIVAAPGTHAYGALSIWCQCHAQCRLEFKISPGNFRPAPKVWSAVCSFVPHGADKRPKNPASLKKLLDMFFQQRRKKLGSIIRKSAFPKLLCALEKMGIDPDLRPENIYPAQYLELSEYVK